MNRQEKIRLNKTRIEKQEYTRINRKYKNRQEWLENTIKDNTWIENTIIDNTWIENTIIDNTWIEKQRHKSPLELALHSVRVLQLTAVHTESLV